VLSALREVQIPLLAVLLIGAAIAKAGPVIRGRKATIISPTAVFPPRLHTRLAVALCVAEFLTGVALLVTAGSFGAGDPAMAFRALTTLLFVTAVGALHELRSRRPEAGCGCFGDLSHTPVSRRVIVRAGLLSLASLATVTAGPLRGLTPRAQVWALLGFVVAEIAVLSALSPEIGEIMVRLGYSEPCELRQVPVSRTLTALRGSSQFRRYRRCLSAANPSDLWREGCWRFAVFPGIADGRVVDVVFAVHLQYRRPAVRAAFVDAATDRTLADHTIPLQRSAPPASAELFNSLRESEY